MDFKLTPEEEAVKKEYEDFFREEMKNAPQTGAGEGGYASEEGWAFHCYMAKILGQKGWHSLPWPKAYGGQDASIMEQFMFNEVRSYHRAPGMDVQGSRMLAPTLLISGTEDQKKEHLPPISRGEIFWCQGWSEPNAGSDLASLTTRAVRDGDDYVINGQKTWCSGAHRAHWCFLLARTNPEEPRHRGLSYFMVDMKAPGISIRPLHHMDGKHMFNEVYFDDVRIPKRNMVGEENRGWYVALSTMNFERSSVGAFTEAKRTIEELVQFCKETERGGRPMAENPLVRSLLAELSIKVDVGIALSYRVAWLQEKGEMAANEASSAKVYSAELGQQMAYTGSRIMGLYGQVKQGSKWAPLKGRFESSYQDCLGINIAAGSNEVQRNIIAIRGLGLPRN